MNITRFWLKRGVDGFRLDTINFYFHDKELRDNPALAPETPQCFDRTCVIPYNFQEHIYDKNRPENLEFLSASAPFWTSSRISPLSAKSVTASAVLKSSANIRRAMTDADVLRVRIPGTGCADPGARCRSPGSLCQAAPEGWACWAFSNHDVVRHVTAGVMRSRTRMLLPRCCRLFDDPAWLCLHL